MAKRFRRLLLPALLTCGCIFAARPASAHPMGNFSINHYADLTVGSGRIRLLYVVDIAEIPTFQELSSLNVGENGDLSGRRRISYLKSEARDLAAGLHVGFRGTSLHLAVRARDLLFPPGAGGLLTERVYLALDTSLPPGPGTLTYRDDNFPGRAGWKEIVWGAERGARVDGGSVPRISRSRALTVYPTSLTSSPPQDLAATLHIVTSGARQAPSLLPSPSTVVHRAEAPLLGPGGSWSQLAQGLERVGPNSIGKTHSVAQTAAWGANRLDALSNLIAHRQLSLGVMLLSLFVAFWFGAGHALSPGHGKTIVAAYLVGSRGTGAHAVFLGATVTATHTAGVFALGLVTLYLSHYIVPDQLYPWLGFISGLLVAGMGATLFLRRLRAMQSPSPASGAHAHTHRHTGQHAHHHSHDGSSPDIRDHLYDHEPHLGPVHEHTHEGSHAHPVTHRHGIFGRAHTHAELPGDNGERITVRGLLGLGISGGLLPCPSALVVLLSAIAFHRVAFGIVLIVAFSFGLATTLTSIGMVVVYGRRFVARARSDSGLLLAVRRAAPAFRFLPVLSALVVAILGAFIAVGALGPGLLSTALTSL